MKNKWTWLLSLWLVSSHWAVSQTPLLIEGNGLFSSAATTNLDIQNTNDNTNALIRFGDNDLLKASFGFNGNEDVFKISMGNTLDRDDWTISESGLIGINNLPTGHRFFIQHNSTSGLSGSSHLTLEEGATSDFARLRFENVGETDYWTIDARATEGSAQMNFIYDTGTPTTIMALDGEAFRVGIHQEAPQAYLHIKQQSAGVDALAIENDNATGGDKWSFRVGSEDILIYFNGDIRGGFDVSTGNYNNFPPSPAGGSTAQLRTGTPEPVLDKVLQLKPLLSAEKKNSETALSFHPAELEQTNPGWVIRSEDGRQAGVDYHQFSVLAIKAIQEQQSLMETQEKKIAVLKARKAALLDRLAAVEAQMEQLDP